MIRPRRIGTKMLLTMCIPLTIMGGIASYAYVEADADRAVVDADAALATSAVGPDGLITLLQDERAQTSFALLGVDAASDPELSATRTSVDAAQAAFTAGLRSIALDAFAPAVPALDELSDIRSRADAALDDAGPGNVGAADDVFTRYSTVIDTLLDGTSNAVSQVDDADLHRHAATLDLAVRAAEADSRIVRHLVVHASLDDLSSPGVLRDTAGLVAARDTLLDRLAAGVDPSLQDAHAEMLAARAAFDALVLRAVNTGEVDLTALVDATSSSAGDSPGALAALRQATVSELIAAVDDHTDASRERQIVVAVALLGLAASIAAAIVGSRAVTRPLHRLVEHAESIATAGLPAAVDRLLSADLAETDVADHIERIEITTGDEVAALASALERVQAAALEQAMGQAVLRRNVGEAFVNLGRRNQALVDRQIEFITELQRNENDPDVMHRLFRLDHLATRMRRNAESLLLLAGEAPARVWSESIPIVDVVRASLGEVEDYRRVEIARFARAAITGTAVADVGHMLAELIENALSFSPPHQPVHVHGALIGDSFRISVIDAGIGMVDEEIAEANHRLSGDESFAVPPSRYLGHYVTGQLAQRHGIDVRLTAGENGGVTAELDMPADLLWLPETVEAPAPTPLPAETPAPEPIAIAPPPATVPEAQVAPTTMPEPASPIPAPSPAASQPSATTTRSPLPKRIRGANLPVTAAPLTRETGDPAVPTAPTQRVPEACPETLSSEAGSVFELFNGIRSGEADLQTATTSPGKPS